MRELVLLAFLAILQLITSCRSYSTFEVSTIQSVRFVVDDNQAINHGAEFSGKVIAELKNGKAKDLTSNPKMIIQSECLEQIDDSKFKVKSRPLSFEDTSCMVHLSIEDELDRFFFEQELKYNYQGSIVVLPTSFSGRDGVDSSKGGNTLFGRDGADGKKGQDGTNGGSGNNFTAHIWKENNEIKMMLEDDSTGVKWKYKSRSCDSIFIDISGANGGNGGKGGEGGNGKDGKSGKLPGNGGKGGNGGDAGNGGNGGSIIIFLHPNAAYLKDNIFVYNHGGNAGMMGLPGLGGKPGVSVRGQKQGDQGEVGKLGLKGKDGIDGPEPVVSIIAFEL